MLQGAGNLSESAETRALPNARAIAIEEAILLPSFRTVASRLNGINFAAGTSMMLVGLLALNRGLRRDRGSPGPVDRALGLLSQGGDVRQGTWHALAVVAVAASLVSFTYLAANRIVVHWNDDEAVAAFKANTSGSFLIVNGNFVYGSSHDERAVHVARFTPALVRACDRANLGIGGPLVRDFEYPIPGVLPLVLLAGLCAAVLWRPPASERRRQRRVGDALLALGLLHLYVVLWLTSAQAGILIFKRSVDPDWLAPALLLFGSQAVVVVAVRDRLSSTLPSPQRAAWVGLWFLVALVVLPWGYHFSDTSSISPATLWLLLYLGLVGVFWLLLMRSAPGRATP
jgi:hypothetical protein